jgi:glycosyltransferase involved in cell wall biosynthesis
MNKDTSISILMNTPDLEKGGGVTTYCRAIRPHFSARIEYFSIGSGKGATTLLSSLARFVRDYAGFFSVLRSRDFSLVHLNPSLGYKAVIRDGIFLLIAKLLRKKVVVFIHGWNDTCEATIRGYFLTLFRLAYFRADAIVVLAAAFQNSLREMGFKGRLLTETTTLDIEMLEHAATIAATRISRPVAGWKLNILFLARIERGKGIYEALEAFRLLRERHADIEMTVVGTGAELENAQKHAAAQGIGNVVFTGFRSGAGLRECYTAADIYLFPTQHGEGFPISIIEAMAYGLPVLTRPVGGIPDFFENGKMGFLTDSTEPREFAVLLERLVTDPELRLEMGLYNHRYAREHFSPVVVVQRLETLYRQVLSE